MSAKYIDLIVLEGEKVIRRNLAKITPQKIAEGKFSYILNQELREQKRIQTGKKDLEPNALVVSYVVSAHQVHKTVRKIMGNNQREGTKFPLLTDSYQHLASLPFAYVTAKAYERIRHKYAKEEETDREIVAGAHYDEANGIFVSLVNKDSLEVTIAHEYGHYLHHTLLPESYRESSSTMKEVMAIFIEEKCGYHTNYVPDLPHSRAELLLQKLKKTKTYGKNMSTAGQWDFLGAFSDYKHLDELAGKLP